MNYCGTLIRPAFCPFCLGDENAEASRRWSTWTRDNKLQEHLEGHLQSAQWPIPCPHPLCKLEFDTTAFLHHLTDDHHLNTTSLVEGSGGLRPGSIPRESDSETNSRKRKRELAEMQGSDCSAISPPCNLPDTLHLDDTQIDTAIDCLASNHSSHSDVLVNSPLEALMCDTCDDYDTLFSKYVQSRSISPIVKEHIMGSSTSSDVMAVSCDDLVPRKKARITLHVRPRSFPTKECSK